MGGASTDYFFSVKNKRLTTLQKRVFAFKLVSERTVQQMKILLKILLAPVSILISLTVWLCAGLISCSAFVFKLAGSLLALIALAVMLTYSVKNGFILLLFAVLASPVGLPLIAVWLLGGLQTVNGGIKRILHS